MSDPMAAVEAMANWSAWVPFDEALKTAPLLPGVYMARQGADGPVVYVGKAGQRASGGRPKGLNGRLSAYLTGKGVVSGLGEAAMDRALADPEWLRERLAEIERSEPRRTKEWGRAALSRADLQVRWTTVPTADAARALESRIISTLADTGLWNRGKTVVPKFRD